MKAHELLHLNVPDTLLIGIGNSGRRDDGLGWAFADAAAAGAFRGQVVWRYQLQVEDALEISGYAHVVFADASREPLPGGFRFEPMPPAPHFSFSSHIIPPPSIVFLANQLYGKSPQCWMLAIEGREWALEQGLSPEAETHLTNALAFFSKEVLGQR